MDDENLATLILNAKGDRSYARLSADCGGNPTKERLQQLATGRLKTFPDSATLEGVARGTSRTLTAVVLAAARSLGLKVHNAEDPTALIIGGAGDLRPDQQAALQALVRSFQATNRQQAVVRLLEQLRAHAQIAEMARFSVAEAARLGKDSEEFARATRQLEAATAALEATSGALNALEDQLGVTGMARESLEELRRQAEILVLGDDGTPMVLDNRGSFRAATRLGHVEDVDVLEEAAYAPAERPGPVEDHHR